MARPCPICLSADIRLRAAFPDGREGYPDVAVYLCLDCLSASSPLAEPVPQQDDSDWHLSVRERNLGYAETLFNALNLGEPPIILDVGCGIGTLIEAAHRRGGGGIGYDTDAASALIGQSVGLDTRVGPWTPDESSPGVNLITCVMVLEHIHQPRALLCDLIEGARRLGTPLFVSVPFLEASWRRYLYEPVVQGEFHPFAVPRAHVSHFSRRGFEWVARELGARSLTPVNDGWPGYLIRA